MAQHTIDLPCSIDTYVDWRNPSASFGSASTLLMGAFTMEGYGPNNVKQYHIRYITMLKFDFSSLPAGKTITAAALRLYSINHVNNNNSSNTFPYDPFIIKPLWYTFSENDTYDPQMGYYHEHEGFRSVVNPPTAAYVDIDFISFINNSDVRNRGIAIAWEGAGETASGAEGPIWQIGARNSANPPIIRVVYEDTIPESPTLIDPIGSYINNSSVIKFRWQYNNTFGVQKKFDFKWSSDGNTWTTVSQVTANNYYDMPADTLPAGNIYWKVITYNEYDEASPESATVVFYSTGLPTTPAIVNVTTDSAKPTITWASTSQQVAEIQILKDGNTIYNSGSIPGMSIRTHKVNVFLSNGAYTARVRIRNEFDLLSGWGTANFILNTAKPTKPPITLSQNQYSISAISDISDNEYILLYRSETGEGPYKCVARSLTNTIEDYTVESNKLYQYFIRAVSSSETFADSDTKAIYSPRINKSVISPVADLSNIFEAKLNLSERPAKNVTFATVDTSNYFSGRTYPVVEYSEHLNNSISVSCFIKSTDKYKQLADILKLKGVVLYRDSRRLLYGYIGNINTKDHYNGYILSFTINQTDFNGNLEE